jgi:hypothetical protein
MSKLYLLNTLVVPVNFDQTEEVLLSLKKITAEEAKKLLTTANKWESVIGHTSTASVLSEILDINVPENRKTIYFTEGDRGVHFFLKRRIDEGKILTRDELLQLEYWLVLSEVKKEVKKTK